MTAKLVIENLKNKPMRSLLSFLLIGVPVTLILTLQGLSSGMLNDAKDRARGVGADILVRASSTTVGVNQSADSVTEKYLPFFRNEVPHDLPLRSSAPKRDLVRRQRYTVFSEGVPANAVG